MYTIGSFLREEELTGLKLMTDTADLQAEITNINIIDNPDSYDWLSSGDFLLTTGYFLRDDEAMQCQLVRELSELGKGRPLCFALPFHHREHAGGRWRFPDAGRP